MHIEKVNQLIQRYSISDILRYAMQDITLCAFLDIEGAFDNTSYEADNRAVHKKRIEAPVRNWINFMLKNRLADNETVKIRTTRGCPQ